MKRILIQLPSFDAGGAENYALRLIRHAESDCAEWHVTTGNLLNAVLEIAFRETGAPVHHASPGFLSPAAARAFYRFLQSQQFDAVMSLNGVFGGLALSLARLSGVPCRVGWHRRSTPAYEPTLGRRAYARVARTLLTWGATRILSNSRAALNNHHGSGWVNSSKFSVIPNGVDSERFRPQPEIRARVRAELGISPDTKVIGHVGRFDPAKDHETLFAVARELRQTFPDICLVLVGTGTDGAEVAESLRTAGISDITKPLGTRDDVDRLYQAMDVFLFPSVTEGQPNALLEAMLSGVPAVASDIPGIRESVPPAMLKRLFSVGDVDAAARLVKVAVSDFSFAHELLPWLRERYDLVRNLDLVLDELLLEQGSRSCA